MNGYENYVSCNKGNSIPQSTTETTNVTVRFALGCLDDNIIRAKDLAVAIRNYICGRDEKSDLAQARILRQNLPTTLASLDEEVSYICACLIQAFEALGIAVEDM